MKSIHSSSYELFLRRLAALRVEKECTQAELGLRLGKPQSYVSKVESGERRIDVVEFVYWAKALEVDASKLVKELSEMVGNVVPRTRRRMAIKQ